MRRIFTVTVVLVVLLVAFAVYGDSLPEGNPLRPVGGWLREFGRKFANGFGGGYNPGTP